MIKSLLEPDEKQPEKIKPEPPDETADEPTIDEAFAAHFADVESPPAERFGERENLVSEIADESIDNEPLAGFPKDEMNFDLPTTQTAVRNPNETAEKTANYETPFDVRKDAPPAENADLLFQSTAVAPESFAETARKSGLAYAAAITLVGSVVFMLVVGWFADLLLGSSPWGMVGGIVLGAAIGFFQFFRLTAQIFKDKN